MLDEPKREPSGRFCEHLVGRWREQNNVGLEIPEVLFDGSDVVYAVVHLDHILGDSACVLHVFLARNSLAPKLLFQQQVNSSLEIEESVSNSH